MTTATAELLTAEQAYELGCDHGKSGVPQLDGIELMVSGDPRFVPANLTWEDAAGVEEMRARLWQYAMGYRAGAGLPPIVLPGNSDW